MREAHEVTCSVCGKKFFTRQLKQKKCHECYVKKHTHKNRCQYCNRSIRPSKTIKICSFCEKNEKKLVRESKGHYPKICLRCHTPIYHNSCLCAMEGLKPLRKEATDHEKT